MEPTKIKICRFDTAKDNFPKQDTLPLEEFAATFSNPRQIDVTNDDYFGPDEAVRREAKGHLRAFSPAVFKEGASRSVAAVESLSCIVLDCDEEQEGVDEIASRIRMRNWRGLVHTTLSDRGGAGDSPRCYRIVLFVDRPLLPDEYPRVWAEAARQLRVKVDPATKDVSRIYFLPAKLVGGNFENVEIPGEVLSVGELLAGAALRSPDNDGDIVRGKPRTKHERSGCLPAAERSTFLAALDHLASIDGSGGYAHGYDTWRNCAWAIEHGLGTSEGRAVFESFSKKSQKYDPRAVAEGWTKFASTGRGGIEYSWVFPEAQRHGWKNPGPAASLEERLTEVALAERMVEQCGDRFVYAHDAKEIFVRHGVRWEPDLQGRGFMAEYNAMLREIVVEASSERGERLKRVTKAMNGPLEKRTTIDNVRALFSRHLDLCAADEFDADPLLLGVSNGVVDLRTGLLLDAAELTARGARTYRSATATYESSAVCPQWQRFIASTCGGDLALEQYLREAAGSCLLGSSRRRNMFILYGHGRNGKSVFLNTLAYVLGDYAAAVNKRALLRGERSSSSEYEIARLPGVRLVMCSETSGGEVLDDAMVKHLTGGDKLTVRQIYAAPFEITPKFTVILATNFKPVIRDFSEGMWDRVRLVPFEHFVPDSEVDIHLADKLKQEAAGILNWMISGLRSWQDRAMVFQLPPSVEAATRAYRDEMDTFGLWLGECCLCQPGARGRDAPSTGAALLHASFIGWCGTNHQYPLNAQSFARRLEERGFLKRKTSECNVYDGIVLREEAEQQAIGFRDDIQKTAVSRARR